MKSIKVALIIFVVLLVVLIIVGLFLPRDFHVSREISIKSNPTHVSVYIVNLNQWPHWSPWKDYDDTMTTKLGETISGVGATQSWTGTSSTGRLEITNAEKDRIGFTCYFEDTQSEADCEISYVAAGEATKVTWSMSGRIETPILGGYLAMLMDGMVGPKFDHGLGKLKKAVEQKPPTSTTDAKEAETTSNQGDPSEQEE